jgi:hypothetical protein
MGDSAWPLACVVMSIIWGAVAIVWAEAFKVKWMRDRYNR